MASNPNEAFNAAANTAADNNVQLSADAQIKRATDVPAVVFSNGNKVAIATKSTAISARSITIGTFNTGDDFSNLQNLMAAQQQTTASTNTTNTNNTAQSKPAR